MSEDPGNRLKPTVMPLPVRKAEGERSARKALPVPEAKLPAVLRPTAIAGTERQKLPVTAADLERLSPGTSPAIIGKALSLLQSFVIEKANERRAILWQQELQKAHSAAVGRTLGLSQAPILLRTQGHVARMVEILRSFDFSGAAEAGGTLARMLKRLNARIDTADEFARAHDELERLRLLLDEALKPLLKLREELAESMRAEAALAGNIEAAALAALHLSEHFRASKPSLADRFLERSMSLTQTLAQIHANRALRAVQADHPVEIVKAIQNVTLVLMPDFLTALSAAQALHVRDGVISPTEASELDYKMRDILHLLQR